MALGALAGIGLAMTSLLARPGGKELPAGAVARVNGVVIREQDYERAAAALAADRRTPLAAADRRHVLDRLIDEELLVQYGISLGLTRSDRRVRADLVSAIIAAQVATVEGDVPSAAEVREFYQENRAFFRPPGRLRARSLWIGAEPKRPAARALERAGQAVARLRSGEPFAAVESDLGDPQVAPVPDALLPPAKLREYVGPTALGAAQQLAVGDASDPVETDRGVRVMFLVERDAGEARPLAALEPQVRSEMKRRAGEAAVRELLDQLRANGELTTAVDAP